MKIPEKLIARIETDASVEVNNLIITLKVHAGRKNPYYILFPKTDSTGTAELTRDDFIGQFNDHFEIGLMDYDGSIETAEPVVEVSLYDPIWDIEHRKLVLAWPLLTHERTKWSSRLQEYTYKTSCRNLLFFADPQSVDLEHTDTLKLYVALRSPRKTTT